jgi:hypothetical protein
MDDIQRTPAEIGVLAERLEDRIGRSTALVRIQEADEINDMLISSARAKLNALATRVNPT